MAGVHAAERFSHHQHEELAEYLVRTLTLKEPVRATRPSVYALTILKTRNYRKLVRLFGSSSCEDLNRTCRNPYGGMARVLSSLFIFFVRLSSPSCLHPLCFSHNFHPRTPSIRTCHHQQPHSTAQKQITRSTQACCLCPPFTFSWGFPKWAWQAAPAAREEEPLCGTSVYSRRPDGNVVTPQAGIHEQGNLRQSYSHDK